MPAWRYILQKGFCVDFGLVYGYGLVRIQLVPTSRSYNFEGSPAEVSVRIGLCITDSFPVFCFLTFITSLTTVTPQISILTRPKAFSVSFN